MLAHGGLFSLSLRPRRPAPDQRGVISYPGYQVAIARQGLKNRNRLSAGMVDESNYLTELEEIAESGITPAERLLELYNGPWNGDVRRVFEDFAY